jgi:hypothetical protein
MFSCHSDNYLEVLRETTEKTLRLAGYHAKIRTRYFANRKQVC